MKICIISSDFPPAVGGVGNHVENLAKALARDKENNVIILSLRYRRQKLSFSRFENGVKIYRFLVPDIRLIRGLFFVAQGIPFILAKTLFKKFDVIHWHNLKPDTLIGIFGRARNKVFTNHTSHFLELYDAKKHIGLYRVLFLSVKNIIAPSRELADKSIVFFDHDPKFVHYIPNGVDPNKFHPIYSENASEIKKEIFSDLKISGDKRIIFCPRRLEEKNGVIFIVEAMDSIVRKIPNAVLVIGGNDAEQQYAARVKKAANNSIANTSIIFRGAIPNSEIWKYYASSDVVVLPSLKEATSIACLEAMSMGAAIVATNVGGLPELIVNRKNGMLVEPGSPAALEEAIVEVFENKELAISLGAGARSEVVEKFSWSKIGEATMKIYKRIEG